MENQEQHKRRVRYKGTHPRKYNEKYKELQPDKYPETVERVIKKGSTPVGMHISICVKEILEFLQIQPGQKGLDATLGYGGHTQAMLECLQGKGHIYGLDVDAVEQEKTRKRLEALGYGPELLTVRKLNFANIDQVAAEVGTFDFVLADLGVSSMQIDNPDRGFSYKNEGPLDLRLDSEKGISAAERLKDISREELEGMLAENSDEPYAAEISRAVISARRKGTAIDTTTKLRRLVEEALSFLPGVGRKSANLIMGDVFGKPAIVTDTHCIRLVNRMGLVDNIKDPKKVEMELWKIIPPEEGSDFCHRLVYHGRDVCTARTKPHCEECCLKDICAGNGR